MRYFALLALLLAGPSCTAPAAPDSDALREVEESTRYLRDRHGNCLAVVLSYTYSGYRVVSIAQVSRGCD